MQQTNIEKANGIRESIRSGYSRCRDFRETKAWVIAYIFENNIAGQYVQVVAMKVQWT